MSGKTFLKKDTSVINRKFSYTKGECSLNFTLRLDIKQELKDFRVCLQEAITDVDEELNKK